MIDSFSHAMPYIIGSGLFVLVMNWMDSKMVL